MMRFCDVPTASMRRTRIHSAPARVCLRRTESPSRGVMYGAKTVRLLLETNGDVPTRGMIDGAVPDSPESNENEPTRGILPGVVPARVCRNNLFQTLA